MGSCLSARRAVPAAAAAGQEDHTVVTVLDILLRNDPNVDEIKIPLTGQFSDAELAQALGQNPHITNVKLDEYEWTQHGARWPALLEEIATRSILEHMCPLETVSLHLSPRPLSKQFNETRKLNKRVFLSHLKLSGQAVANFIDNATSLNNSFLFVAILGFQRWIPLQLL